MGVGPTRGRRTVNITANLRTTSLDFRGFDSSVFLILRGGIPRPVGNLPESLRQAILVGIVLVGRVGVFFFFLRTTPKRVPDNLGHCKVPCGMNAWEPTRV